MVTKKLKISSITNIFIFYIVHKNYDLYFLKIIMIFLITLSNELN